MEIIKIKRFTDDEIVFRNPEDIAKFYEIMIEQPQPVILEYTDGNVQRGVLIKPDFGSTLIKGTVKLRSESDI